jgi:alkaline phosphatase
MRFFTRSIMILFIIPVLIVACATEPVEDKPLNIILLIGDGMAEVQITAAKYAQGSLHMERFPHKGSVTTHSTRRVTDSAAGATALSTGYKTDNGMLAMLPDGTPLQTIAHYANEIGKSTAIMADVRIVHATPAGFGIHHDNRRDEFVIAEKYVDSGIDMLLGSGYTHFLPEEAGGSRTDGRNLIAEMEEQGYVFIQDEDRIEEIANHDRVVAFLTPTNLSRYPERGDQMNRLAKAALKSLSNNDNGFFMMIEGGQIDWAGHDNDANWMIQEMIAFDNVIGDVLDFAEQDGNTLVVVTADHETGGLTLRRGETNQDLYHSFSSDYHTAVMVPVLSYGPGAERFSGIQDNTDVARHMFELWGKTLDNQTN